MNEPGSSPKAPRLRVSTHHRSYSVVFFGLGGQILLQFLLSVVLAQLFGASFEMDAYRAALTLPIGISAVLAGSLGPVVIAFGARNESRFDKRTFTGAALAGAGLSSVLIATVGWALSDTLTAAILPNFGPEEIALTARLFRVLVWLIPANTLIGLSQSLLNASLVFGVPALAGILGPLLTVGVVIVFGRSHGMFAVAAATLAGAFFNVAIQLPSVLRRTAIPCTLAAWKLPPGMLRLAVPILLGMLVLKIDPLIDRHVSSYLPTGSIARLDWSYQVVTIFIVLASGTLSTVAFPRIAVQANLAGEALDGEIGRALRTLVTLCIPALAVLVIFPEPIVRDIFERGAFTPADTAIVAMLVRIYAFLLIGAAMGELGTKTMYALHDSVTPTAISCLGLGIGFTVKLAVVPTWGLWTLPVITSTVYLLGSTCQLATVRLRTSSSIFRGLGIHTLRCGLATAVALGIGGIVLTSGIVLAGILGLVVGAACYFSLLVLLDAETKSLLIQWWRRG